MKQKNNHGPAGTVKVKDAGRRLFAALLMFCLVLTMPCTSTLAQNGIQPEDALTDADGTASALHENGTGMEKDSTSGNTVTDGNGDAWFGETEIVGEDKEMGVSKNSADNTSQCAVLPGADPETATGAPKNPIHHHTGTDDSSDTTTWSYVYFGTYPQSEVTDAAVKIKIDEAIDAGNGIAAGTEESSEGIDVWVDDMRYRRISKSDCNYDGRFDNAEKSKYRYFKWEPIKWRVLKNDNSTLFVAADMAVDCKCYNDTRISVTWEKCTLRSWLNGTFYQNAFSSEEQEAIVEQNVVNENNPIYQIGLGGNNTIDKVYLLSYGEVTNEALGFCNVDSCASASRRLKPSDYAKVRGVLWKNIDTDYEGCQWLLRSPGNSSLSVAYVFYKGMLDTYGTAVEESVDGVVPVLHINLSSDLWSMVDGGNTDDSGKTDSGTGNSGNTQNSKVKVSQISLTGISKKIAAGKKIKLTEEVLPANATDKTLIWTSSNPGYATVDALGNVTTKKTGAGKSVTITAMAKDGSGVQAKYQIKLMKHAVKKVKITAPSKTVKAGKKLKLKATVTTTGKNANKKLKWTSSNENYATVSSSGVVKASKAGKGKTVTITATATDGTGKKAKIKIKIQ